MQLPLGVFGTAIGTAILPTLSSFAATKDMEGMKDTMSFGLRFTFFIAIPAMTANVVFNLILMAPLKHAGIALATSLSAMLNLGLLVYYLPDSIRRLDWHNIKSSVIKNGMSSAIMGGICWLAISNQPSVVSHGAGRLIWFSFTILTGLIVYFGMTILIKCEEMRFLIDAVKSKF